MSYLKERVAFLKGLAEGMQISDATNEGKLLKTIIDVMDDFALSIEDIEEIQDQMGEQVDNIDEDLAEIEKEVYDIEDEDEEEEEEEEDICFSEIECPHCSEKINVDVEMIDDEGNTIECPNCHEKIDVEWECDCEECDHDH
jgi:hypothetical protein